MHTRPVAVRSSTALFRTTRRLRVLRTHACVVADAGLLRFEEGAVGVASRASCCIAALRTLAGRRRGVDKQQQQQRFPVQLQAWVTQDELAGL